VEHERRGGLIYCGPLVCEVFTQNGNCSAGAAFDAGEPLREVSV
jgi:hypothetical protein